MSTKPKFEKLRLRKNIRSNSQISRFFSIQQNDNSSENSCNSENNAPETPELDNIPPLKRLKEDSNEIDNLLNNENSNDKITIQSESSENVPFIFSEKKCDKKIEKKGKLHVKNFFNQCASDSDFEIKKQRNKINVNKNCTRKKPTIRKKQGRQPKIKSAFLKNEEFFSEVVAQHGIAENINPDELQLALALSKSEIELTASAGDISEEKNSIDPSAVRAKLQEFGFKTSKRDTDYDIKNYYLPGKKKTKWANKFTPLTLRNPERQAKKLEENISKILDQPQIVVKQSSIDAERNFTVVSNFLKNFTNQKEFIQKLHCNDKVFFTDYYVLDLFTPTEIKIDHLLRDYRKIPGRDLSPARKVNSLSENNIQEVLAQDDQLILSGSSSSVDGTCTNFRNEEILPTTSREDSSVPCTLISAKSNISINSQENSSNEENMNFDKEEYLIKKVKRSLRDSSPDLFADSEQSSFEEDLNTERNDSIENNPIISFEKYSSDEVKASKFISNDGEICSQSIHKMRNLKESLEKSVVDLTADTDSEYENESQKLQTSLKSIDKNKTDENMQTNEQQDILLTSSQQEELTQASSDSSCIILSDDDEVSYSIKMSNKKGRNQSVDLKFSSNFLEEDNQNNDEFNKQNFSFTQLLTTEKEIEFEREKEDSSDVSELITPVKRIKESFDDDELSKNSFVRRSLLKSFDNFNDEYILKEGNNYLSNVSTNRKDFLSTTPSKFNRHSEEFNEFSYSTEKVIRNVSFDFDKKTENSYFSDFNRKEIISSQSLQSSKKIQRKRSKNTIILSSDQLPTINNIESIKSPINDKISDSFIVPKTTIEFNNLNSPHKIKQTKYCKTYSDSFINQETIIKSPAFKRYSSCSKYNAFIQEDIDFSDTDEIDKLIYGSPIKKLIAAKPKGLDKLINSELSFQQCDDLPQKFTHENRVYLVRTEKIPPKPDYERMDSPTRLKELYKFGLKPLKKKQAIKILEYIYNQTHPFMIEDDGNASSSSSINRKDSITISMDESIINDVGECNKQLLGQVERITKKYDKFKLRDCFGDQLLACDGILPEKKDENYIYPTNIKSKIPTVMLPLHLAWYNLVKSSYALKEAIMHYEVIELQEIYLFFKGLGYRYDQKDLKRFFDDRCILFRYDLNDGTSNRHIRKSKKAFIKRKT